MPFLPLQSNSKIRYTNIFKHIDCSINLDDFDRDYEKKYLNIVLSKFVRSELGLSGVVKIKKNGTFSRTLYIYVVNTLVKKRVKIQKFQYNDSYGKKHYVSVFPSFIFKYNPLHEELIDLVISNVGKGENVLEHINDTDNIIDCEDIIASACSNMEKKICSKKLLETTTAKYVTVLNLIPEFKSSILRFNIIIKLKQLLHILYPEAFSPLYHLNRKLSAV